MTAIDATKPTVLVLDDEKNIRGSIEIALEPEGYHVLSAHDAASAMRTLNERVVDLLLLDIRLGDIDGLTFFKKLQSDAIDVPVIFISGHATLTEAAQAVKLGGFDFLEKPFTTEKLAVSVRRCLEYTQLQRRLCGSEAPAQVPQIVGESQAISKLISESLRVAQTKASVLIMGESGTGKELVANSIHAHSSRRDAPFVKVNCSAIPENLIESELFGHERGAFTGAASAKRGLFEVANRGTIFLDEIADLALPAQAKILRVLQSGEIQKVGSERSIKVDVRVLSGTHKDLKKAVANGAFREDLYYRLNVVPLRVPSLRERAEDIPLLVRVIARRLCAKNNLKEKQIDEDVLWELKRYAWPGNVRELENVLERMLIMSGERITVMNLPDEIFAAESDTANTGSALREFRDKTEREYILTILRKHNGNVSQAAVELGVRRPYLHKRMSVLGIAKKDIYAERSARS
jgi:two-component system, NtrC family, nitrogen regulation response regulator NtrX